MVWRLDHGASAMEPPPGRAGRVQSSASLYEGIRSTSQTPDQDTDTRPPSEKVNPLHPATSAPAWSSALRFVPRKRAAPAGATASKAGKMATKVPSASLPTYSSQTALVTEAPAPGDGAAATSTTSDSAADLPPPPMQLAAEEVEEDKRIAQELANERGDVLLRDYEDEADRFGPRWSRAARIKYGANYDPSEPNDYYLFRAHVEVWRRQRGYSDASSSSDDEGTQFRDQRFAPPVSYAPLTQGHDASSMPAATTQHVRPLQPPGPPPPRPTLKADSSRSHDRPLPPGPPPPRPPFMQAPGAASTRPVGPTFVRSSLSQAPSPMKHDARRAGSPPQESAESAPDTPGMSDASSFAERLMAQYGYHKGHGLVRCQLLTCRAPKAMKALLCH